MPFKKTDHKDIANLLQTQFKSVFSTPSNSNLSVTTDNMNNSNLAITYPLQQLNLSINDIIKAINEIKITSSCASHNIPAKVFKNCKYTLSYPLKLFWERSFETGIIPKAYKKQHIIPLPKKDPKTLPQHWRPITLNPHEVKMFERVIRIKLVNYLESNSLLNSNQHGFRQNHSCATQLLSHTNNILSNLISGDETDSIYLDYSKAFDKIDHSILLNKLKYYKISDKYYKWIENYLKDRTQVVYVNNTFSYPTQVVSGVPQGSVLGPILFVIFINDLINILENCTLLTFADDTKIVSRVSTVADTQNLQTNLNKIISWSETNNMELNHNKFDLISHKPSSVNENIQLFKSLPFHDQFFTYYASNNTPIYSSEVVRDLGLFIDNKLNWNKHISTIVQKSKQLCGWICSVFYSRESDVMLTLFRSLIRTRLEYCCEIWNPHLLKDIRRIEQVQRSFTVKINGMREIDYWSRLEKLKIRSLQRRREKQIILHVWKILNNVYPNSINLEFKETQRPKAIRAILNPLPRIRGRTLTLYESSFIINSVKLWRILPPKLTYIDDLNKFKLELDKFLNTIPDKPPLPNYPYLNKNSLIDHCSPCI